MPHKLFDLLISDTIYMLLCRTKAVYCFNIMSFLFCVTRLFFVDSEDIFFNEGGSYTR